MATMKLDGHHTYCAMAGADLSAKLHYLAKLGTDGRIVLCGSGDKVLGSIFAVEPGTINTPVTLQTAGGGKVIAGAAIVAGVELQSDGNGAAITLSAGKSIGVAINGAAAAGEIIEYVRS